MQRLQILVTIIQIFPQTLLAISRPQPGGFMDVSMLRDRIRVYAELAAIAHYIPEVRQRGEPTIEGVRCTKIYPRGTDIQFVVEGKKDMIKRALIIATKTTELVTPLPLRNAKPSCHL